MLSETYFPGLGALGTLSPGHFHIGPAVNAHPQVIYTPGNGFLSYDQDGNAATYAPTHFASVTPSPVLDNTDFLVIA